ncbi:GYDIA family GHMP kinase [Galbibacter sp.]|jgi:mevalonate kinase|uniref:GYDIA family GHMP kinase n=1 Tax=Galbibacter sp. TaxID=2918471 RepID=UPI003A91E778
MLKYRSNGKLLITGEYVVLDGALALAVPSKYGQSLSIETGPEGQMNWIAYKNTGEIWFEALLDITNPTSIIPKEIENSQVKDIEKAQTLSKILVEAQKLNPNFLNGHQGYTVETRLDFPTDWGLGSSSTLIANIAQWAEVNPYTLLWNGFTGSGYDIACALAKHPLTYQLQGNQPRVQQMDFNPIFHKSLFFIHLNKKQNSREGIKRYKSLRKNDNTLVEKISQLTTAFLQAASLEQFEALIEQHENYIASAVQLESVKQVLFSDFKCAIKSLGAWGGDFILATGEKDYVEAYFQNRGYSTIIPYTEMVY